MISTQKASYSVINKNENLATIRYVDEDDTECIYQGEIDEDGKFDGYGKLWNPEYSYHGFFKNDNINGEGELKYTKKSEELNNTFPIYYKGIFLNNKRNGEGIEKYANKEFYKGNFLNDFRHGEGIFCGLH